MGPPCEPATGKVCPHPDCSTVIAETSFSCLSHWKLLPRGLRTRIDRPPTGETRQMQAAKAQRVWAGE